MAMQGINVHDVIYHGTCQQITSGTGLYPIIRMIRISICPIDVNNLDSEII